jgi:glycine betaine/choline ABC-type transport system substrate-binding protein
MPVKKLRYLLMIALLAMALGLVACGSDDDGSSDDSSSSGGTIEKNAANADTPTLTIGSKNFTEQIVLGEIYAQALEAAGYNVKTDLNLGSETVALAALKKGEISGYPEYISTALTSFFDTAPEDVPGDVNGAYEMAKKDLAKDGITALTPPPFASANAVGMLTSKAEELGVSKISDLEGKSQDLKLYGSPECRQRIDCLLGLQQYYGLDFKSFTPVDIGLRYTVLDKGQADLSIVFTTDAQLGTGDDKYTILEDDKGVLPAGNVIFLTKQKTIDQAGADYAETIELVQEGLTEKVMQELDARVDLDKQEPADVAHEYLVAGGYISE